MTKAFLDEWLKNRNLHLAKEVWFTSADEFLEAVEGSLEHCDNILSEVLWPKWAMFFQNVDTGI